MSSKLFYIRDRRTVIGNCVLWWCPDSRGYTTELEKAGLFEESKRIGLRETDEMIPESVAKALVVNHVRSGTLDDVMAARRAAGKTP